MILGLQLVLSQGLSLALVDLHLLALLSPRVSMAACGQASRADPGYRAFTQSVQCVQDPEPGDVAA